MSAIPTQIIPGVQPDRASPAQIRREFKQLSEFARWSIAADPKNDPQKLFRKRLVPNRKLQLFDTTIYFTPVRQIPELRFYVAFVVQKPARGKLTIYPRIFYKDLSLVWRSASHFCFLSGDIWVGKGDVRIAEEDGWESVTSIESTTDLPIEIQSTLEILLPPSGTRVASGNGILELVLKQSPPDRIAPYRDFSAPRLKAQSDPRNLINGDRPVARFKNPRDPESLVIQRGFEPDFKDGTIGTYETKSKLYGGRLRRFRILSTNRKIQYYFFAGATHVWLAPPQTTTTQLSSYAVRTIDVPADDDLFIPGYEYHHYENTADGTQLYSQIPEGFAGEVCPFDDVKADASPWLDRIPLIREFRKRILG